MYHLRKYNHVQYILKTVETLYFNMIIEVVDTFDNSIHLSICCSVFFFFRKEYFKFLMNSRYGLYNLHFLKET